MDILTNLATAFGLSASAGLNAYIPLFILAVVARYTDWFKLSPPYDVLTSPWVIGALAVLILIEFFADKIPIVDHANDVLGTVIRPAAGALLFASTTGAVNGIQPEMAVVTGLLIAGTVHAAKASARPLVTATTGGLGNPVVSTVEDTVATVVSFGAILLPLLFALIVAAGFIWVWWAIRSFRRSRRRPRPT